MQENDTICGHAEELYSMLLPNTTLGARLSDECWNYKDREKIVMAYAIFLIRAIMPFFAVPILVLDIYLQFFWALSRDTMWPLICAVCGVCIVAGRDEENREVLRIVARVERARRHECLTKFIEFRPHKIAVFEEV